MSNGSRLSILNEFKHRWCDKPANGHQLEWNGKLGFVRFNEDGGLVHQTMPAHSQHRQDPRERNAPMQQNSSLMDAWTKQTTEAIAKWRRANPNSHQIVIDHESRRWRCTACGIHGFKVISTDTTRATQGSYTAFFNKTVATACTRHQPCEAITFAPATRA